MSGNIYSNVVKIKRESIPDVIIVKDEEDIVVKEELNIKSESDVIIVDDGDNVVVKKEVKLEKEWFEIANSTTFKPEPKAEFIYPELDCVRLIRIELQERHKKDTLHTKNITEKLENLWKQIKHQEEVQKNMLIGSGTKLYHCPTCDRTWKYMQCFYNHILQHLGTEMAYSCTLCAFKTNYLSRLQRHKDVHQRAIRPKPVLPKPIGLKPILPKPILPKPISLKPVSPKHIYVKRIRPKRIPPLCVKSRIKNYIKKLFCKRCPYQTTDRTALTLHLLTHKNFEKMTFGLFG